jgi:hypothetical protein
MSQPISSYTASKELVATLLWVKQGCLRYWLLLGSKSISNGAQNVTLDSKIYCKKVKMCWFTSGNWFSCTKIVQLLVAGKRGNTFLCAFTKECINWTWLQLSISDWSIIMISPDGLLLVVPTYMQFHLQFYWWGYQKKKKKAKLRHLILLSRVTYWAPVEML